MQRMKPWHGYLRLFHLHAKYRSATTVWGEDTRERGVRRQRVRCLCNKLPDWSTTKRLFHTKHYGNRACSITHCPCHGPFEARSPVPMGEGGTRPHHMVFYVAGCSTLQESWAVKGRIMSIGLINVVAIKEVFFITGPETLRHTAPLPGQGSNKQKGIPLYM